MKKILILLMLVVAVGLVSLSVGAQRVARGEEVKKKEKDVYALSYLGGYKCYKTMADRKVMFKYRLNFTEAYKLGFADALIININESAFDKGFQDASNGLPSQYKEDILKSLMD